MPLTQSFRPESRTDDNLLSLCLCLPPIRIDSTMILRWCVVHNSLRTQPARGNRFERRLFQSLFATKDQKEGMAAFAEKRKATFTHE